MGPYVRNICRLDRWLFLSKALGTSAIVTGLVLICEHFVVFGGLGVALSRIISEVPVEEEPVIADAD